MHIASSRVHVVMSAEERALYRGQAQREGESLSEWLRGAARHRLAHAGRDALDNVAELDAFLDAARHLASNVADVWPLDSQDVLLAAELARDHGDLGARETSAPVTCPISRRASDAT